MTSGKIADINDPGHVLSSFKIPHSAFHNALKMSLSIKYGFVQSILIVPSYSSTSELVMRVLCQHIVILTSLVTDVSMFKVILSYVLKQSFDNI